MYAVFDGHDGGGRVADYAADRFPAELLLERLPASRRIGEKSVYEALFNSFLAVERGFFDTIGEALARRVHIQAQIPPVSRPV